MENVSITDIDTMECLRRNLKSRTFLNGESYVRNNMLIPYQALEISAVCRDFTEGT